MEPIKFWLHFSYISQKCITAALTKKIEWICKLVYTKCKNLRIFDKYVNGSWWGGAVIIEITISEWSRQFKNIFMLFYSLIYFDSFLRLNSNVLLDHWPRPEGSYKIGSVRPSVLPSVRRFSRDLLVRFFWNLAWCYWPIYSCVWQSRIFWKKSPWGKNNQRWSKMAQIHGFGTFEESHVISFVWSLCKMKVLMVD